MTKVKFVQLRLVILVLLLLNVFAPAALEAKMDAVDITIYDEALNAPWQDFSYSSTIQFDSVTAHAGTKGIAVTHTGAFGALSVNNPTPLSGTDYQSISFWARGAVGGSSITLSLGDNPTEFAEIDIPNEWTPFNILLSDLGSPATFNRINWQSTSNAAQPTYHLDEIVVKAKTAEVGFPDATPDGVYGFAPGPSGVAVAPNGRVYAAVYSASRVYSWPSVTSLVNGAVPDKTFGSTNGDPDKGGCTEGPTAIILCGPESLAVDSNNNLFVADTYNHRILVFNNPDSDSTPTTADAVLGQANLTSNAADFDSANDGVLEGFCFVRGLAVDGSNRLWAVDEFNFRVIRFDTPTVSGSLPSKVFGQADLDDQVVGCKPEDGASGNTGMNQFSLPLGIAVDAQGTVYVTDFGNDRVQRFAAAAANGANAEASYTGLNDPHDVAVDAKGNVYVADTGNGRVLVFAGGPSGDLLSDHLFPNRNYPMGMAFTAAGDLLVADCGTPATPDGYPPCVSGTRGVYFFAAPEPAQNQPPNAVDDTATTLKNTPVSGNVLTNDVDPQGSALTVTGFVQPDFGSVTVAANGLYTYTPPSGFSETASFLYTVSNSFGLTDTATVSITVNEVATPAPPVAVDDTAQTLENTPVSRNVLTNDSDPQDSPLTVTAFTQPGSGTVTVAANGVYTYTPPSDFLGSTSFNYTVTNAANLTDTATVSINVVEVLVPEFGLFMPALEKE